MNVVKRPAEMTFQPQSVILIQFEIKNEKLVTADFFEIDKDCLPPSLSDLAPLLFAISLIKEVFGNINLVSYALAIPNECNCYLVGCYNYLEAAENLVHECQGQEYDTGCHWEVRAL